MHLLFLAHLPPPHYTLLPPEASTSYVAIEHANKHVDLQLVLQVSHSARCGEMYAGKHITSLGIEKKIKPCTDWGETLP